MIAQESDGDHHEVDLIADFLERLTHRALGVRGVLGVKENGVGLGRAVLLGLGGGDVQEFLAASGEYDRVSARGAELLGDRARDVRTAAQYDDVLGLSKGVIHGHFPTS